MEFHCILSAADIIDEDLPLPILFQLGDVQSLWHFLALWSPCRLNVQVQFADKPVICPAVCTTHNLCHSDILPVLPSYYDIINEMLVFGATSCWSWQTEDCVSDQQFMLYTPSKGGAITVALSYSFSPNHSFPGLVACAHSSIEKKKVREKSRECHNHKPQPFPDPKRKRKPTNLNKHKSNKRTKSTKISSLFPKRGNRNT